MNEKSLYEIQSSLVAKADSKSSFLAVTSASLTAALFINFSDISQNAAPLTLCLISATLIAGAFVLIILSLTPRLGSRNSSLLHFRDIAAADIEIYKSKVHEMTEEEWRHEYISQAHELARISQVKFKLLRAATAITVMAVFASLGTFATHGFINLKSQSEPEPTEKSFIHSSNSVGFAKFTNPSLNTTLSL